MSPVVKRASLSLVSKAPRVIAFDPGGKTGWAAGWATFDASGSVHGKMWGGELDSGGREGESNHVIELWDLVEKFEVKHGLDAVVCEDFMLHAGQSRDSLVSPVRIGAKLHHEWWNECMVGRETPWVWQLPGEALGAITDERLKRWGLWVPGQPHRMDATRHLLYYTQSKLGESDE